MQKIFTVIALVLMGAPCLAGGVDSDESAQSFERLADGRVVIEIHGQRLAFPTDEKSLDSISFSLDADAYKDAGVSPTLRHLLAEPNVTKRLLKEETDEVIISHGITLPVQGSRDRIISAKPMPVRIQTRIWPDEKDRKQTINCNSIDVSYALPKDITVHDVHRTPHKKFPLITTTYCLAAEKRKFKAQYNQYFRTGNTIHTGFTSTDGRISITSSFSSTLPATEKPYFSGKMMPSNEKPYPTETTPEHWAEVDRQLQQYFSNMFISLPEGALQ